MQIQGGKITKGDYVHKRENNQRGFCSQTEKLQIQGGNMAKGVFVHKRENYLNREENCLDKEEFFL